MPRAYKLLRMAYERGEKLEDMIQAALDEHGTVLRAAVSLGVYPGAIYHWLNENPSALEKYQTSLANRNSKNALPESRQSNG